jgi:hypothetical protein
MQIMMIPSVHAPRLLSFDALQNKSLIKEK